MLRITKKLIPFILLLGTVLIAFRMYNLEGFTVITQNRLVYSPEYTWTFYTIDFNKYLQNLETSIDLNQLNALTLEPPVLPTKPSNDADVIGWVQFVAKLISVYAMNWIILIINALVVAPIKILCYPVNIIFAILGINTSNNDFITVFRNLYQIAIPYIPYW